MKKILKITFYLSFVLAIGLFNSCEETDDYDYNSINPVVQGIVGPTTVRGGTTFEYRAVGRGGSTYDFSSTGAITNLSTVTDKVNSVSVDFAESFDDAEAVLSVVETTMGGKNSPAYEIPITVTALDINLTGNNDLSVIEDTPIEVTYTVDFLYPGASYSWSFTGEDAEVVGENTGSSLVVKYNYPTESIQTAAIAVQVTTRNGNVLNDDMDITFKQFCPLVIEELIGSWESDIALDEGACPQTAEITEVDAETNTIYMTGFADFLVNCSWGESWVDGDGTVAAMLHEPEGLVTIPLQWIGQSNYPDNYWVQGELVDEDMDHHGTYDFCGPVIKVKFNIAYGSEKGEDGLPVDPDALTWVFADPVESTFTLSTDTKNFNFKSFIVNSK